MILQMLKIIEKDRLIAKGFNNQEKSSTVSVQSVGPFICCIVYTKSSFAKLWWSNYLGSMPQMCNSHYHFHFCNAQHLKSAFVLKINLRLVWSESHVAFSSSLYFPLYVLWMAEGVENCHLSAFIEYILCDTLLLEKRGKTETWISTSRKRICFSYQRSSAQCILFQRACSRKELMLPALLSSFAGDQG